MMNLFKNLPFQHRDQPTVDSLAALSADTIMKVGAVEAWATDPWVPAALLRVEEFPKRVVDPCVGLVCWADALAAKVYELTSWKRY